MAFSGKINREDLVQALMLVGLTPNGESLNKQDLAELQEPILIGMLDAAVEQLAQTQSRNTGTGKSHRPLMLKGYQLYLRDDLDLRSFFIMRLERIVGDMRSGNRLTSDLR